MDVLLGESRTYISEKLRQELGWGRREWLSLEKAGPQGLFLATRSSAGAPLKQRGGEWYFEHAVPGVSRGRLNGSRTCKHSVQNGTLILDVRELLSPQDA